MAQYRVLASEGWQRYIYTKTHKNIKEKQKMFPRLPCARLGSEPLFFISIPRPTLRVHRRLKKNIK
jgi:hypothetical protein